MPTGNLVAPDAVEKKLKTGLSYSRACRKSLYLVSQSSFNNNP